MASLQRSPRLRPGGIPYCLNRNVLKGLKFMKQMNNLLPVPCSPFKTKTGHRQRATP
jgi:hypothetical protein